MSRVLEFSDGAERGDLSWWNTQPEGTADTAGAVHGTYCYLISASSAGGTSALKTISTPLSELYFRCYVKVVTSFNLSLQNSATVLLTLAHSSADSRLNITGGATGNTGDNSIIAGTWYCLEVYYKISDTVGVVTVRIDGVQKFTFSGDTKPGADTAINNFLFYTSGAASFYLDDLALDTASWCGLGYYVALTPNAAGDVTQWTPTGGANYANVSIPADDATYNTGATGQIDNYAMTTLTVGQSTVERVIPWARASNPVGGTLNVGLKTGGTNYTATATVPTSATWLVGAEYTVSPNTSAAWTQTDINNIQFTAEMP